MTSELQRKGHARRPNPGEAVSGGRLVGQEPCPKGLCGSRKQGVTLPSLGSFQGVVNKMGQDLSVPWRCLSCFLPRSKCLLISWLQSPSEVILEPQSKVYHYLHCFPISLHCFPIYLPWSDGTRCHDLHFFECWVLSQVFPSPLSLSSRGYLVFFTFCHKGGVICIFEVIDISPGNLDYSLSFIQPSISHDVFCI